MRLYEGRGAHARLCPYFDGRVYGTIDDYKSFSNKILIQRTLSTTDVQGGKILGFGAAMSRSKRSGPYDWKRQRLIGVGADYIVPDFLCHEQLVTILFS